MRISSDPDHPDYPHHDPSLTYGQVYLDGKKLDHCFFADEQRGEAWVYKTFLSGRLVVHHGDLKRQILIGDIKIKFDSISAIPRVVTNG